MKTEKRHKDIDREQPIDINPDLIRDDARDVGAAFMRESAPRFDADREWQRFLSLRPEAACDVQEKPSPRATFRWLYAFGGAVAGIADCLIILFSLGFFTKPEIPQEEDLVLFAAVKAGRFLNVDPEDALNATCEKFIARFRRVEEACAARGAELSSLPLDELTRLWNEAKHPTD